MKIEIIQSNIENVINQPCRSADGERRENGIAEYGGVKYIYVKVKPDDSSTRFNLGDDLAERILEYLPDKYREHLVTIRHRDPWSTFYVPVFDSDTQEKWNKELEEYIRMKAEWCEKYGCE